MSSIALRETVFGMLIPRPPTRSCTLSNKVPGCRVCSSEVGKRRYGEYCGFEKKDLNALAPSPPRLRL